jgi:hypothetical protein
VIDAGRTVEIAAMRPVPLIVFGLIVVLVLTPLLSFSPPC